MDAESICSPFEALPPEWAAPSGSTARRDTMELLTAAIRVVLLLAAAVGFAERSGVVSALRSAFAGMGS
jgi:hypothetical protein